MDTDIRAKQQTGKTTVTRSLLLTGVLRIGGFVLFLAASLFLAAGRLDWWMAWAYVGVYVSITVVGLFVIMPKSPELAEERAHPKEDSKEWDRRLTGGTILLWPATLIVAGLDLRFGWSPRLALSLQLTGLAFLALGNMLGVWAMASNKFYSRLVRIQKERGHTVATSGPYRYVRHPGYAGVSVYSLATPLLLSSLWAFIPTGIMVIILIVRTALEDRVLHEELPGYVEYAQRTRYRLLPGIW